MKKKTALKTLSLQLATVRVVSDENLAIVAAGGIVSFSGCKQTCGCPVNH